MSKFTPVGAMYQINQTTLYWHTYYKLFGNPFIHYHVCFRYLRKILGSLKTGTNVIDFGCGDGTYLNQLAYENKICGTGIEQNAKRLEIATKVAKTYSLDTVFECKDTTAYEPIQTKYDCGICFDVLEHLDSEEINNIFKVFSNSIKLNGVLVLRVPHDRDLKYLPAKQHFTYGEDIHKKSGFTLNEISSLLTTAGFKIDTVIYQYYFLAQLNYELSELIRNRSKLLYSIYSAMFRWISFAEIYFPVLNFGRANGIMVSAIKVQ